MDKEGIASSRTPTLHEVASFVTSKNAGPYRLTLDIVFPDEETYRKFVQYHNLSADKFAQLYRIPVTDVIDIINFEPANAVKVTLRRRLPAGSPGDTDVYGSQQHVLMLLEVSI